jgi:uncharacterized protein YndB with AHSA1/START domain
MKDDAVITEIDIDAPPERVFRALTDSAELTLWWGEEPSVELKVMEMDPRVGGRWRFEGSDRVGHSVNGVREYVTYGEVLAIEPPRLLIYTWISNWHEHPEVPTTVRWDLEPTKTGTRVRVTHSGLANEPVARKDYTGGWVGVLELLKTFVGRR